MAGRGDLAIFGVPSGIQDRLAVRAERRRAELDQAHAAIAGDRQLGMIAIMRHIRLAPVRTPGSSSWARACRTRSGVSLRHFEFAPVHLHLDLFNRRRRRASFQLWRRWTCANQAGARARPVSCSRSQPASAHVSFARRSSSAAPLATNSSLNFADETLHRPGAGFAERANRAAAGNVVGDLDQVIRVARRGLRRA